VRRLFALARNPVVRLLFLLAAVGLAAWAIARDWASVTAALDRMDARLVCLAVALSFVYVAASMQSWRSVMADVGSPLNLRSSADVFLVSQMGKYVPGGVWNVVAGAELARDRGVSRARAAGALAMTMLVSVVVGIAIVGVGATFAPHGLPGWVRLGGLATPVALYFLTPQALTRALTFLLRLVKRPGAAEHFSTRGVTMASLWSAIAWVMAGLQVWVLGVGLGLDATLGTLTVAIAGFAAAWLVGLAILFLPAGVGARELVLFPVFAHYLDQPTIVVLVIASRVLFTIADAVSAAIPLLARRRTRPRG